MKKLLVYNLEYRERYLTSLIDKYTVRDYIAETIGDQYLIPLYGCYESVNEISIDALPDRFIMKANHGSGWNIICFDKHSFEWDVERSKLDEWMRKIFTGDFENSFTRIYAQG